VGENVKDINGTCVCVCECVAVMYVSDCVCVCVCVCVKILLVCVCVCACVCVCVCIASVRLECFFVNVVMSKRNYDTVNTISSTHRFHNLHYISGLGSRPGQYEDATVRRSHAVFFAHLSFIKTARQWSLDIAPGEHVWYNLI
jgi:hypothetical protein